ncbi:MAG: glycosyltransferase family 4 protein, partial [Rhodothermales bacterium]|nr:glycosyltransferase family 4 protein [Rhodothermales bacterium]
MRILLVSQDFPPGLGGIQTYAFELARNFEKDCSSFAVIAPWIEGCEVFDSSVPFEVIRIRASSFTFPFKTQGYIRRFRKQNGLDWVINVQWFSALGSKIARLTGQPFKIAIAVHGRELLLKPFKVKWANRFRYWAQGRVLSSVDKVLPVSNYTRSLVEKHGVPSSIIRVVNNGANVERFGHIGSNGTNGRKKTVLTVSRLVERKGIDTVLRSLPTVLQKVPELSYVVVGDGPDLDRLTSLAQTLNVDSHVEFVGPIAPNELPELYHHCDVFVMPSRNSPPDVEGFGIVFLEANACGKPVIGARTGGIPDAILHRQTGLLVDADNDSE